MWLKYVQLKNFRNYLSCEFNFYEKKNIITGKNGSGKTSLLEAIYIISNGKSFRSPDFFIPNYNSDTYYIKAELVETEEIIHTIEISYTKLEKRKLIKFDTSPVANFSRIIGTLKSVLFAQKNLLIIDGSPEIKRKFLNRLFAQIDDEYYSNLIKYTKILESRNFVLKQEDNPQKFKNIEILNQSLIEYGSKIVFKRFQYVSELSKIFTQEIKKREIDLNQPEIKYISNIIENSFVDIENIKENYLKLLEKELKKEILLGHTIYGPHRDSIIFINRERYDLSEILSLGEKRVVSLITKFAEFYFIKSRTSDTPVILMDDILLELDDKNRYIFIEFINSIDTQFFITAINSEHYNEIKEKEEINLDAESI